MPRRITITDVAQAARVSTSTVSRVLNQRPGNVLISETTRQRVQEIAERLGYQSNPFATALRRQRTGVLGVIVRDIADPFLSLLIQALQQEVQANGYTLLLGHAAGHSDIALSQLNFMLNSWFDGLFLVGDMLGDEQLAHRLRQDHLPCVALACGSQPHPVLPFVNVNEQEGTLLALDYLCSLGHQRIAFLGSSEYLGVRQRLEAFEHFVRQHGLFCPASYVQSCPPARNQASVRVQELLGLPEPPTALFCATDLLALGAMHGVLLYGKRIPEQISIIGFDDIEEAADAMPAPLTTVRQPTPVFAHHAMRLLLAQMQENPAESNSAVLIAPELIRRGSCSAPWKEDDAD